MKTLIVTLIFAGSACDDGLARVATAYDVAHCKPMGETTSDSAGDATIDLRRRATKAGATAVVIDGRKGHFYACDGNDEPSTESAHERGGF
jgi:hypothetical protein